MKATLLAITTCALSNAFAEPLAVGEVSSSIKTKTGNSHIWSFTVSKDADPGIRFFPSIRFVLDDETWIDGRIGCGPAVALSGSKSGGEIAMCDKAIPEGRKLMYVDIVAAVGDPKDMLFGVKQGEAIPYLTEEVLTRLKKQGGVVLRFPMKNAPSGPRE